jgi:hypothetical protein
MCVAVGLLASGCSAKRVAECDDFLGTIEKLSTCDQLPAPARTQIQGSAKTMRDALKMLEDAGGVGSAPADLVTSMRDTCRTQNRSIREQYAKLSPDCLK